MDVASIITWIVFGLIVGVVANLIDPSPRKMGMVGSIVLGILGAALGGLVAGLFGFSGATGFNLYSFVIALLGALAVLWIGRSLWPAQEGYGPSYYDESLTEEERNGHTTVVKKTETEQVTHHDTDEPL